MGDTTHSYPVFKVGPKSIIDFPTFGSAVDYMEEQSRERNLYRSRIIQCPLFEDVEKRGAQWLYNQNGELIDCTTVQKTGAPEETHFFGRPMDKQRFKPGDIAELLIDDEVTLVLIVSSMQTPEECWQIYNQQGSEYSLNFSADSYAIIKDDEGKISFAIATALMKPRFPITREMKAEVESRYETVIDNVVMKIINQPLKMIPILKSKDELSDDANPYGNGENPPYSLYQSDNGRWGLIDGSGNKLKADFKRVEKNSFSRVPWEVVIFNPQEGFELGAWYDPGEVWFNFTFNDPAYPAEYTAMLWEMSKEDVTHYRDTIYELIPNENHWLIDEILRQDELRRKDDDDFYSKVDVMLFNNPELMEPAITNPMLDPVMKNPEVDKDVKVALWRAKVSLDHHIRAYKEDDQD